MKFRQRQILVSFGLFCFGVVVFLHTRTPDGNDTDHVVEANRRDARAFFVPKAVTLSRRGGGGGGGGGNAADAAGAPKREDPASKLSAEEPGVKNVPGKSSAAVPLVFVNQSSSSDCPTLLRPENVQETQVFQKVDGSPSLLEFSAFLDVEQAMVRVVGLSVTRGTSVFCLMWYRPGGPGGEEAAAFKELRVQQGRLVALPEHHGRKYTAHYIECPLPDPPQRPYPYAVSVTSKDCRQAARDVTSSSPQPSNVIPVLQSTGKLQRNFTVCVTALNYRYSKAYELVEMIELNRLLGAQLFTFYVNSVGDNVAKVLRWYAARGLVQLVAWDLPMTVDHWPPAREQPEVHYFGQLASHNDCLNRHRGVSRFLVYQDLDEFIIPKQATTWTQLLDDFKGRSDSGFLFRCVFFRKEWPANSENFTGRGLADKFRSIVLATDKREPTIYPFNHRAKYIVDPLRVQTVGIHNVWKYRAAGAGGGRMTQVSERQALLHHYRSWENPGDAGKAVRDTDIYRFKDRLLQSLEERWSQLPQVPLDIPLSEYGQV